MEGDRGAAPPRPRGARVGAKNGQTGGRKGGEESRFTMLLAPKALLLVDTDREPRDNSSVWNEEEVPNLAPTALLPQYF